MGRTVNPLAYAFVGSNPTSPTFRFLPPFPPGFCHPGSLLLHFERMLSTVTTDHDVHENRSDHRPPHEQSEDVG